MIMAPTDRYTPFPVDLKFELIERTSLRSTFFSEDLSEDLSIAFISSKRASMVLTSAGISLGLFATMSNPFQQQLLWLERH